MKDFDKKIDLLVDSAIVEAEIVVMEQMKTETADPCFTYVVLRNWRRSAAKEGYRGPTLAVLESAMLRVLKTEVEGEIGV